MEEITQDSVWSQKFISNKFLHNINTSEWTLESPNTGMTKNSTMPLIFRQKIVIEREISVSKTQLDPKGF